MAGLVRLFRFFVLLVKRRFYGQVTVRFADGQVHGQILVDQTYTPEVLPQVEIADLDYQAFLHETHKGI